MCETPGTDWLRMLTEAAEASSKADVARELGISRVSVSMILNGKYPGDTSRMAARVLAKFDRVTCPYTGRSLTRGQCAEEAGRDIPTSSPAALRQWRACKKCKFNPKNGDTHDC